jgi:hypothetical protein
MLPLLWLLREGLERRQRVRLLVAWILAAGVTIGLYTHNFKNAVPSQFAYGQGNEVTVDSDMSYFVHNLDKAATFALAVMGGHLSRGLNLQNLLTAQVVGAVSLVLFAACCAFLLARRRDRELIVASVPWLAIGGYSIGTAVLITIGRLWRSRSGSLAVDGRYVSHAIPLTIALVALAFIIGRRQASKMPKLTSFGWLAGGVLLMLVTTEWIYGEKVMELWQQARLQGKALLLFAKVFPNHAFLGPVSGDADYGHRLITEMERLKLLREPLADSLDLPQHELRKSSADLRPRLGQFKMLQRMKDGRMMTDGFAELPDQRPADLIIFTWSPSPGVDTIFGLTTLERLPRFYGDSTYKDHEFCSIVSFGPEVTCQWNEEVSVASIPPDDAAITAWAVDIQKRRVFRIDDARALPSVRLPKGVYRNSEVPRPKQP